MQDYIYNLITSDKEITWQTIIQDLVKSEQMDPWDIDISLLTKKYLETIKKLDKLNFSVSGKILLASALLLKIKSDKLLNENLVAFDNLMYNQDEENYDDFIEEDKPKQEENIPKIYVKTPQARKRKVTLQDLISSLNKAINVNERRIFRKLKQEKVFSEVALPTKKVDITGLIKEIYNKIKEFFVYGEGLTFTKLVGSSRKEDKIMTFIPLLHLESQNKINLHQEKPFGNIDIKLKRKGYY